MVGLFSDQPASDVRLLDPYRVKTACHCADQIHKLLKIKLDAIRLANSIVRDSKK